MQSHQEAVEAVFSVAIDCLPEGHIIQDQDNELFWDTIEQEANRSRLKQLLFINELEAQYGLPPI